MDQLSFYRPPLFLAMRSLIGPSFLLLPLLVACAGDEHPDTAPAGTAADAAQAAEQGERMSETAAYTAIEPVGESGVTGVVTALATAEGVQISYSIDNLEPGLHGFHVHENGACGAGEDGTPGGAAGGHFNPGDAPHGGREAVARERHAGDFSNIEAGADGRAVGTFLDPVAKLEGPDRIVGKAMMIHSAADDLTSQPSGDAGARVGLWGA